MTESDNYVTRFIEVSIAYGHKLSEEVCLAKHLRESGLKWTDVSQEMTHRGYQKRTPQALAKFVKNFKVPTYMLNG